MPFQMNQTEWLELQSLEDDMTKMTTGLKSLEDIQAFFDNSDKNEQDLRTVHAMMSVVTADLGIEMEVGFESIITPLELSMETLAELPLKIYNAIARAIKAAVAKFKSIWRALTDRSEKNTVKVEEHLQDFKERTMQSEETIKHFNLVPGKKVNEEEAKELEEAKAFVFKDITGAVLAKEMYENDMSLLIPAGMRFEPAAMMPLVFNKSLDGLIGNIKTTLRWIDNLTAFGVKKDYDDLINAAMSVDSIEKLNQVITTLIPAAQEEDLQYRNSLKLRKEGPYFIARPILGEVHPTFHSESAGGLKLTRLTNSFVRGRLVKEQVPKVPKKLPKLTRDNILELQNLSAVIKTKIEGVSGKIDSSNKVMERYSNSNGKVLMANVERLKEFANGRNEADITKVANIIRGSNAMKTRKIAYSHLSETHIYLTRLAASIDILLIKILGRE